MTEDIRGWFPRAAQRLRESITDIEAAHTRAVAAALILEATGEVPPEFVTELAEKAEIIMEELLTETRDFIGTRPEQDDIVTAQEMADCLEKELSIAAEDEVLAAVVLSFLMVTLARLLIAETKRTATV